MPRCDVQCGGGCCHLSELLQQEEHRKQGYEKGKIKSSAVMFYMTAVLPSHTISWFLLSQAPAWSAKETFKGARAQLQSSSIRNAGINVWDQTEHRCSSYIGNCLPLIWERIQAGMTTWIPFTRSDPDRKYCSFIRKENHECAEWPFETCLTCFKYLSLQGPWVNSTVNLMLVHMKGSTDLMQTHSHCKLHFKMLDD